MDLEGVPTLDWGCQLTTLFPAGSKSILEAGAECIPAIDALYPWCCTGPLLQKYPRIWGSSLPEQTWKTKVSGMNYSTCSYSWTQGFNLSSLLHCPFKMPILAQLPNNLNLIPEESELLVIIPFPQQSLLLSIRRPPPTADQDPLHLTRWLFFLVHRHN